MKNTFKQFAKWLLPTPLRVFEWGTDRMLSALNELRQSIRSLSIRLKENQQRTDAILEQVQAGQARHEAILKEMPQAPADRQRMEGLATGLREAIQLLQAEKVQIDAQRKTLEELQWGQIFTQATSNSDWLKNRTFSPGRWAMGYPGLYVLYRILNDVRPRRILELGLGESTRMVGQYTTSREDCEHIVVEHDLQWISFCKEGEGFLSDRSKIVRLTLEKRAYLGDEGIVAYAGFAEAFKGRKFDLVVVDGPFGFDAGIYSRIDILEILPAGLADSFVILMDDYNRKGEQNTLAQIRLRLEGASIPFLEGKYSGQKDVLVICSPDLGFMRSL